MDPQQRAEVQAIMERLWAVEDAARDPGEPAVLAAAGAAVEELSALLAGLGSGDAAAADDPLSLGRAFRYLGDAHFTLSAKTDQQALRGGRQAYLRAEPLLEAADDPLELAKLQFNLANTTRLLEHGRDRALLEEAKRRYHAARDLFKAAMPEAVPRVESSLQSLEIAIQGLGFLERAAAGKEKSDRLMAQLQAAGDDPGKLAEIRRRLDEMREDDEDPAGMLARFSAFVDASAPLLSEEESDAAATSLGDARAELDSLLASFQEPSGSGSDQALFKMMFNALEKAGAGGEIGPQRQEALRSVLAGFQRLAARPAKTPEEMSRKAADMREHIAAYKAIFMDPEMGGE